MGQTASNLVDVEFDIGSLVRTMPKAAELCESVVYQAELSVGNYSEEQPISLDAPATFVDVSVPVGMVTFTAAITSINGTTLLTRTETIDAPEESFGTIDLVLEKQSALLELCAADDGRSFILYNWGSKTLTWTLKFVQDPKCTNSNGQVDCVAFDLDGTAMTPGSQRSLTANASQILNFTVLAPDDLSTVFPGLIETSEGDLPFALTPQSTAQGVVHTAEI